MVPLSEKEAFSENIIYVTIHTSVSHIWIKKNSTEMLVMLL